MFSGFSSYLGFSPQGSESVQALLQKSDLTLDELLDDETLLTEVKTLNSELLDFLKRDEIFMKMLNHVISEPSAMEQQLNPQKCFKFPLVCTDVLSSECAPLVRYLLNCNAEEKDAASEDGETFDQSRSPISHARDQKGKTEQENNQDCKYIDYFFSLLDAKELNYTAAGYFSRILSNAFERHPADFLPYIYKKRPGLLEKLVNQISSESLAELLVKLLSFESGVMDDVLDETYNVKRIETVKLLIQKLDAKQNPGLASNAAHVLKELIGKSRTMHKGNEVLDSLFEKEAIESLYNIIKTKDTVSVSAVAMVLGSIFNHYIIANPPKEAETLTFDEKPPQEPELSSTLPVVSVTVSNIKSLVDLLADALEPEATFGTFRMKLLELLGTVMEVNNTDIISKIVEAEFFKVILKLLLKFEWHSLLHNKVEKLVVSTLLAKHENLKISLMENGQLLNVIIEAFKDQEVPVACKQGKKIRKGHLGQLAKIANKVNESYDPVITKYTQNNGAWEEYVMVELNAVNGKHYRQLGGLNPKIERYGSFEIQNPAVLFSSKAINLDYEDQQNDQEGSPDDFKIKIEENRGFKINCDAQDDTESPFSIKKAHFKFSQLGGDKSGSHRAEGQDEDQEIVEEVIDTCLSPPIKMKSFKFEEPIDETIEEEIEADQIEGEDTIQLKIKL